MEDEKQGRLARAKQHLKDNKTIYLVGGGCLMVGTLIEGAVVFRRFGGFPLEISQTAKNQALINWKPEITQIALIKKYCPDPIPVRDKITGIPYPSINQAAKAIGKSAASIRNDVHGAQELFERLPDSVFA